MPDNLTDQKGELFDSVADTKTPRLKNAVENVDGITADEEKDLERGGQLALRGTKRNIFRFA